MRRERERDRAQSRARTRITREMIIFRGNIHVVSRRRRRIDVDDFAAKSMVQLWKRDAYRSTSDWRRTVRESS